MFDGKAFGEDMTEIVRGYVDRATAPLIQRLAVLEARPAPEKGDKGDSVKGDTGVGVMGAVIDRTGVLVLTLSDGTTRDLGNVVGKDSAGADMEAVKEEIARAIGELPPLPEFPALPELAEVELPRSVAKCLIGKEGDLIVTYSDGMTESLGEVVGRSADLAKLEKQLREMVDAIPKPKDGRNGFSLEDFDVEAGEDGRTVTLKFQQGDVRHAYELVFPVVIDRGVFKADREDAYMPGDGVTWGGSYWIAQRETKAKPDIADSGWRLSVKKGRDGKDAK